MPEKNKETDRRLGDVDKLEKFKKDLTNDAQTISEQRDQANEDSRFINVPGGQWEGAFGIQFTNRAKLELDIISQHRNRYVGEVFENDIGVCGCTSKDCNRMKRMVERYLPVWLNARESSIFFYMPLPDR